MRARWLPLIVAGGWNPELRRAFDRKSGAYAIREKKGRRVLYVGESHTDRGWKTLTRHFQDASGKFAQRSEFTHARPVELEGALWLTSKGQPALNMQAKQIERARASGYDPIDDGKAEARATSGRDRRLGAKSSAAEDPDAFDFGANVENPARLYDVRGVLAGCYRGGPKNAPRDGAIMRSHYYDVTDGPWGSETTLCGRIKDATARLGDLSEVGPATCPLCVDRFEKKAAKGLAVRWDPRAIEENPPKPPAADRTVDIFTGRTRLDEGGKARRDWKGEAEKSARELAECRRAASVATAAPVVVATPLHPKPAQRPEGYGATDARGQASMFKRNPSGRRGYYVQAWDGDHRTRDKMYGHASGKDLFHSMRKPEALAWARDWMATHKAQGRRRELSDVNGPIVYVEHVKAGGYPSRVARWDGDGNGGWDPVEGEAVAKGKTSGSVDRASTAAVEQYYVRYAGTRGHLPRATAGMMPGRGGWPVHDVDARDGGHIAFFTTREAAESAVRGGELAAHAALRPVAAPVAPPPEPLEVLRSVEAGRAHSLAVADIPSRALPVAARLEAKGLLRRMPARGSWPDRFVVTSGGSHELGTFRSDDPGFREDSRRIGAAARASSAKLRASKPAGYGETETKGKRAGQVKMFNPSREILTELGSLAEIVYLEKKRRRVLRFGERSAPCLAFSSANPSRLVILFAPRVVGRASKEEHARYVRVHWGQLGKGQRVEGKSLEGKAPALGPVVEITYVTRKGSAELVNWWHTFGDGGRGPFVAPSLIGEKHGGKLFVALRGGSYTVNDRGIVG